MGVRRALLGGQEGKDRRQGIDGEPLSGWQVKHLPAKLEPVAYLRPAVQACPDRRNNLDTQVVQVKRVVHRGCHPVGTSRLHPASRTAPEGYELATPTRRSTHGGAVPGAKMRPRTPSDPGNCSVP